MFGIREVFLCGRSFILQLKAEPYSQAQGFEDIQKKKVEAKGKVTCIGSKEVKRNSALWVCPT
jgi:hypothetical protein